MKITNLDCLLDCRRLADAETDRTKVVHGIRLFGPLQMWAVEPLAKRQQYVYRTDYGWEGFYVTPHFGIG